LLVGDGRRRPRHTQATRELTGWRQAVSGPQAPLEDGRAKLAKDLARYVAVAHQADVDVNHAGQTATDWSGVNRHERISCAANTRPIVNPRPHTSRSAKGGLHHELRPGGRCVLPYRHT